MKEVFCVAVFNSTNHAIQGEKILKNRNIEIKVIPTPREITASCGLSIKFDKKFLEEVLSCIQSRALNIKGIYEIMKQDGRRTVNKVY
ncbi:hypothetical protein Y919_08605 [Caloranaerobacter azorensis H53214]|uniref:Putative Se/S carrier protein-like domain-containing protein n=1 Tax=Caloranaerobacter azorensis H53214 TaxID=1156417 RepID=A0A096DL66_9FIRM|nr:hypothetical protein Y919_08605 [Caloranaerobacter azorensis H53214]